MAMFTTMQQPTQQDLRGMTPEQLAQLTPQQLQALADQGALTRYANDNDATDIYGNPLGPTYNLKLGDGTNRAIRTGGEAGVSNAYKPTGDRNLALFALLAGGMGAASMAGAGSAGAAGAGTTSPAAGSAAASGLQGYTGAAGAAGGTGAAVGGAGVAGAGAAGAAGAGAGALGGYGGLISAGLGAVAGGSQSSPENLTSGTQINPEVKPYVMDYMNRAQGLMNQGPNSMQQGGYNAIQGAAGNQQLLNQGQQTLGGFMGGQIKNPYAGSNPYLQNMIDQSGRDITQQYRDGTQAATDSAFARSNAFGGSAWQAATGRNEQNLARQLSDMNQQYRFNDYTTQQGLAENQLGRQMQATMFSPSMDAARYTAGNQMMNAGDNMRGWQDQSLNNYGNAVRTGMGIGSTNTQTNPYQTNRLAGALGGALGAYQIFNTMGR